jgi:mannitol-specific phosphotransferase system IIBC component
VKKALNSLNTANLVIFIYVYIILFRKKKTRQLAKKYTACQHKKGKQKNEENRKKKAKNTTE